MVVEPALRIRAARFGFGFMLLIDPRTVRLARRTQFDRPRVPEFLRRLDERYSLLQIMVSGDTAKALVAYLRLTAEVGVS